MYEAKRRGSNHLVTAGRGDGAAASKTIDLATPRLTSRLVIP
jgi:hypothetical protein